MSHIVERVVQMAIFLLLSAALKHILLYKICCASVQHSLSPPESSIVYFIVVQFHSQDEFDISWQGETEKTEKKYKCTLLRCLLWSQILSRTTGISGGHNTECNTPSHCAWWGTLVMVILFLSPTLTLSVQDNRGTGH